MPIPKLVDSRTMLEHFGYDIKGKSAKSISNAAARLRKHYKLRAKSIEGVRGLRYYLADVEAAIEGQPTHRFG